MTTWNKKHKKIHCYHFKNDKDSVENENKERRTVIMTQRRKVKVQQLT